MIDEKSHKARRENHNHSFFGAFFLICIGILLLLNNMGYLSWIIWTDLFRFWPVLLIIAGIQMIFPRDVFSQLLASIIGILIVGFIVVFSVANLSPDFDNYINNNFSFWKNIRNTLPAPEYRRFRQQRVLPCNPFDDSCQMYMR